MSSIRGVPPQRENPIIGKISGWFILSSVGNIAWLFLSLANQTAISTLAMLVILVSLIIIYLRLGIWRGGGSSREGWLVHTSFSIYLGWITVATVANIAAALYDAGVVTLLWGSMPIYGRQS
ncbi:MAG TPA: hypothetical protein PLD47_07680 [Aggregatilineales bacterium]|nr:hypothetical protein [Anaerolineales bacterium]HRE47587.1 hypothetical protein [Aggregatilineales bacterium]